MGLLEERERAARQRVEVLQAELREAEAAWERFVIARETVGQVLTEPRDGEHGPVAVPEERPRPGAGAVTGRWCRNGRKDWTLLCSRRTTGGSWPFSPRRAERRRIAGRWLRRSVWLWSPRRSRECTRRPSAWPDGAG